MLDDEGEMRKRKAKRQMEEAMTQYQSATIGMVDRELLGWVPVFRREGGDVMGQTEEDWEGLDGSVEEKSLPADLEI